MHCYHCKIHLKLLILLFHQQEVKFDLRLCLHVAEAEELSFPFLFAIRCYTETSLSHSSSSQWRGPARGFHQLLEIDTL